MARTRSNNLDWLLCKSILFPYGCDGFLGIYDCVMIGMNTFFLYSLPRVCHDRTSLTLACGKRSLRGATGHSQTNTMTIMHSDDDKTSNLSMEALPMLVSSKQRRVGSGTPISAVTSWLCPKNFEDLAALVVNG
jgi:hypothetical protein